MNDQGSLTRASRVKREVSSSGAANGNAGGLSERYAAAAASALAKGEKRSNVAGFLAKAYQIFDNPAWSEICGWGEGGETVVIRKQIEFAQQILPLFFSHSNLQSFVRQLNMYNFRKVVQDPNSGEFRHELFRKGNEHLLHKIKRKQSAAAASAASASLPQSGRYSVAGAGSGSGAGRMAMAGGIVEEADNVLDELVKLRKWKEDMENTVVELKRDKQTLQSENQMLKGQVAEHGQQQMMLQTKMQKILFCIYDAYVSGLPALTAAGELEAGGVGSDGTVKSLVAANGSVTAAGSALEKALQQLAALAGMNMSSRIDQLHMENPWAMGAVAGGAGGGGEESLGAGGVAAASAAGAPSGSGAANGGVGTNGGVVGGGSLKRNRTWSQTSYEWLRSLRDPDPLESIGSPASSAQEPGSSGTPDAHACATAGSLGDVGFSTSNNGNEMDAATTTLTPERSGKRQRRSSSLKVESGGSSGGGGGGGSDGSGGGGSSPPAAPAAVNLLPPPPPAGATSTPSPAPAAGDPTAGGIAAAAAATVAEGGNDTHATSGGGVLDKNASFQADAPLPKGMSFSGIVEEAEAGRYGVAAAGGNEGSGEIWGGGALSRKLSEQATQVVSELGEMGHREGEALTKIDSLGYQLANLLDPNMSFDEMQLFDEPTTVGDVTVAEDVEAEGVGELADSVGASGGAVDASGMEDEDGHGNGVAGGPDGAVADAAEASAGVDADKGGSTAGAAHAPELGIV
eukprot:g10092.t1